MTLGLKDQFPGATKWPGAVASKLHRTCGGRAMTRHGVGQDGLITTRSRRPVRTGGKSRIAAFLAGLAALISTPAAELGAEHSSAPPAQGDLGRTVFIAQAPGGDVRWILPGPRALDPAIFGNPQNPTRFEPDTGVPLDNRLLSPDRRSYTTTLEPTPFSNAFASIDGGFQARMSDRTATDRPDSQDQAGFQALFTSPDGLHHYQLVLTRILPVGHAHPFFGGVLINGTLHGRTGFGTALQPTAHTYAAFWGIANLFVDDRLVADNRMVHLMTTRRVRSPDFEGYRLAWEADAGRGEGIHTHVLVPNMIVTNQGILRQPVPTGFRMANGMEQSFIHLMFENTEIGDLVGNR